MANITFNDRLDDVQEHCQTIADYLSGDGTQRLWMIPKNVAGPWVFEPDEVEELKEPFDRSQVNTDYEDVLKLVAGTDNEVKATMAAHIQLGYLACMERAFRERHRLLPRAYGMVQGRKMAHGDAVNGVHIGSVLQHVLDIEGIS